MAMRCGSCGSLVERDAASHPCPQCGGMDRDVSDGDHATWTETEVRVDGDENLLVLEWREQWDRVQRWYQRLVGIAVGRPHNMDLDSYWDDVLGFFQNCFHFKDWLKNDPASG